MLECAGQQLLDYVRGKATGYLFFYNEERSPAFLAEYRYLESIRSLSFYATSLTDEDLSRLLQGYRTKGLLQQWLPGSSFSTLSNLEILSIEQIETLSPEGLQRLWTDSDLPKLRTLTLRSLHSDNDALYKSLFESDFLIPLTSLAVLDVDLKEETLRTLFQRFRRFKLQHLSLSVSQCSPEFLEDMLFSNEFPELSSMSLHRCPLTYEELEPWEERLPFRLNSYSWG